MLFIYQLIFYFVLEGKFVIFKGSGNLGLFLGSRYLIVQGTRAN